MVRENDPEAYLRRRATELTAPRELSWGERVAKDVEAAKKKIEDSVTERVKYLATIASHLVDLCAHMDTEIAIWAKPIQGSRGWFGRIELPTYMLGTGWVLSQTEGYIAPESTSFGTGDYSPSTVIPAHRVKPRGVCLLKDSSARLVRFEGERPKGFYSPDGYDIEDFRTGKIVSASGRGMYAGVDEKRALISRSGIDQYDPNLLSAIKPITVATDQEIIRYEEMFVGFAQRTGVI